VHPQHGGSGRGRGGSRIWDGTQSNGADAKDVATIVKQSSPASLGNRPVIANFKDTVTVIQLPRRERVHTRTTEKRK